MSRPDAHVPVADRPQPATHFAAPWQAQIFSLVVQLGDRGVFSWSEWADALGAAIREAQAAGDPDLGDTYYQHWIHALEHLLAERGLADDATLSALAADIEAQADHTREQQRKGAQS